MIESVAEQMKPATVGMLTLGNPKKHQKKNGRVKLRQRKPAAKPKTRTSKRWKMPWLSLKIDDHRPN